MSMPSFSAEASLYRTGRQYSEHATRTALREIRPSLQKSPGIGHDCPLRCESRDGNEICCCDVGQKCVTTLRTCECRAATGAAGKTGGIKSPGGQVIG